MERASARLPQFVADFTRSARISAELGQWSVLAQTLREWKATAAIYADSDLLRQLTQPLTRRRAKASR